MTSTLRDAFLPVYDTVPEDWENARQFLVEQLKLISNSVNVREIAYFIDSEYPTGGSFIPTSSNNQEYRSILRKVVDCGSLPNATTSTTPHGITVDQNFTLLHLYGGATKPTVAYSALPLPYPAIVDADNIEVSMDDTNIIITTATDFSAYTRVFVTVEYIQEV